jgi:hypothetical protein
VNADEVDMLRQSPREKDPRKVHVDEIPTPSWPGEAISR